MDWALDNGHTTVVSHSLNLNPDYHGMLLDQFPMYLCQTYLSAAADSTAAVALVSD